MPVLRNTRHEMFARARALGHTAASAYELAGYQPDRHHAWRLATNSNVTARVKELCDEIAGTLHVTAEQIALQLDADRELAHEMGQSGAAVSASVAKAKLFGFFREKQKD